MSADYIIPHLKGGSSIAYDLLPLGIVVEVSSIRGLPADRPLHEHLGFNHMPSHSFFLLSSPSRLKLFAFTLWLNEL